MQTIRSFLILVSALVGMASSPALAVETAWQEVAPGVQVRLIGSGTPQPDGRLLIGLEVDMPQSTKIYWHVPGETGVPTEIDLSRSSGITLHETLWPYPLIDNQEGLTDYAYYGHTVVPVAVTLSGGAATVDAKLMMGVCSDVCIPVSASFTMPLKRGDSAPGQDLRMAQALAEVPLEWSDAEPAVGGVRYDAADEVLVIEEVAPGIDPVSIIADVGIDGQLFGAPQKSRDTNLVLIPLLGGDGLTETAVRLTFMTDEGPFSTWSDIALGGSTAAER
ncbi:protein-disulfide reductase DsbD domain-containing protein [Devosia sp.]|uniref:protein-disulfide reductase DsbD domain-containing protein n=1 Tax=Devosia sp. TaxID=1871048 RepID=UPI003A91FF2B